MLPPLVHDWHDAHRWLSMRGMTAGAILCAAAASLALAGGAASWISVFSLGIVLLIATAIFVASMVGRLLLQKPHYRRPRQSNAGKWTS